MAGGTMESTTRKEFIEKLLQNTDHIEGMERLEMIVSGISYPFAHVARVVGKINPTQPKLWARPNIVVRIEVGGKEQELGQRPLTRVYTIRRFEMATHLIEIDFVIHEGDAPAMHWLDKAKQGTSVFMIGPRQHRVPDYNLGKKIAFFADDTGIPALYAIFSQWPQGAQAEVYIDCADADYAAELPPITDVAYHVHVRNKDEEAGQSGYLPLMSQTLEKRQDWQIWVACERGEARAIRTYFIEQCGLEKDQMQVVSYWKHGTSSSQLDYARLAYYAELHQAGKSLQQFEEFDVPI